MAKHLIGSPHDPDAVPVGGEIARLRHEAELTGQQLGDLAGMSQAKVSRIETGASAADPADVEKLARALHLGDREIARLVELAERGLNRMTDWRSTKLAMVTRQHEIGQFEEAGREVRVFQPAAVPGLLQTSEYARAVMTGWQRMLEPAGVEPPSAGIYEAVSARLHRHQVLASTDRRFSFVMAESVLSSRLCRPEEMLGQIQRIRELADKDNIFVGIIPADAPLSRPLVHGFELIDDKWLVIDLFNTSVTSRGASDIRLYLDLFESLKEQAITDIDDILDKHLDVYLEESRQRSRLLS